MFVHTLVRSQKQFEVTSEYLPVSFCTVSLAANLNAQRHCFSVISDCVEHTTITDVCFENRFLSYVGISFLICKMELPFLSMPNFL